VSHRSNPSDADTSQERVVDEARNILRRLDEAREWHAERERVKALPDPPGAGWSE